MARLRGASASASREQGFLLLETMVAFIIAALALTILFSVASGGLRSVSVAGRYQYAVARAQSHLAAVGAGAPLAPERQEGDDGGGYRYSVRVTPSAIAATAPGAPRPELFEVVVTISWTEGGHTRLVRLASQRLGLAPPPAP